MSHISRLQPLKLTWGALLTTGSGRVAAAAPGWDSGQATQGLIMLGGFAVVLVVGLVLLARTVARLSARERPRRR